MGRAGLPAPCLFFPNLPITAISPLPHLHEQGAAGRGGVRLPGFPPLEENARPGYYVQPQAGSALLHGGKNTAPIFNVYQKVGGRDPKLIWVLQTTSALRWKGNKWEEHGTDFPDREKLQLGERKEHNLNSKNKKRGRGDIPDFLKSQPERSSACEGEPDSER